MKNESQLLFFLATENVVIHVKERYQIQEGIIEIRNFVPEAFLIHQVQNENRKQRDFVIEGGMPMMLVERVGDTIIEGINPGESLPLKRHHLELGDQDDDDKKPDEDDEDWDEEDEDWDEEDEDWDEDVDEDWDEDDEEEKE